MLSYTEMIDLRQEVKEYMSEFQNITDMIELSTFWDEMQRSIFPQWRQRVRYCTESASFISKTISNMETTMEKMMSNHM